MAENFKFDVTLPHSHVGFERPTEPNPRGSVVVADEPLRAPEKPIDESMKPGWWTSPRARLLLLDHCTTGGNTPEFYQVELNKIRCGTVRGQAEYARFLAEDHVFEMAEKKRAGKWTLDDQQKHETWLERNRLWWTKFAERVVAEGQSVADVFEKSLTDFSGNSYEVKLAAIKELGLVELLNLNGVLI